MSYNAKSFGTLEHTYSYKQKVSVSFDTLLFDSSADIKVLVQIEPNQIYNIKEKMIWNQSKFDLILSWDEDILEKCKNSKQFVFGTSWVDPKKLNLNKQNEISFLTSDKNYLPGHLLRQEIYQYLRLNKSINDFKVLNLRSPPRIQSKDVLFEKSKYSIAVENVKVNNFITEKLIDCFVSKTIPIYYGCPNVGNFFNSDGILHFDTLDELKKLLHGLTPEFYEQNQKCVEENYQKSLEYVDFHERIKKEIEQYIQVKLF